MIVVRAITDSRLDSGNVTLTEQVIRGFWNGDISTIWVTKEDGTRLESYNGELLRRLIMGAWPVYNKSLPQQEPQYYLSKRFLMG